jgi:hypothetical protein
MTVEKKKYSSINLIDELKAPSQRWTQFYENNQSY